MSDLHLEFFRKYKIKFQPEVAAETLVLAGDIDAASKVANSVNEIAALYKRVIYVRGNHDFYGRTLGYEPQGFAPNVEFLDDKAIMIDGKIIFGGTLWTNYGEDIEAEEEAKLFMYDFVAIKGLTTERIKEKHYITRQLIADITPDVVITHHAPSYKSVNPKFKGNKGNPAFANSMDYEMEGIKLWIHGHMHDPVDYMIGECRVVANPHGYMWSKSDGLIQLENPNFNPALVIEI